MRRPNLEPFLRRVAPLLWRAQSLRLRLTGSVTLGAKVIVLREGEVLLVRHTYRPGWYLPGGGVKRGEAPDQCARRELQEEVGVFPRDLQFAGLFANLSHSRNDHITLFVTRDFAVQPTTSWEIAEARFFPTGALPPGTAPGDRRRIDAAQFPGPPTYAPTW